MSHYLRFLCCNKERKSLVKLNIIYVWTRGIQIDEIDAFKLQKKIVTVCAYPIHFRLTRTISLHPN